MRIVFFGTPDYAVPSLHACLRMRDAEVVAVVTQPDRPRGRSGAVLPTPVKTLAVGAGVRAIFQPERIHRDTADAIAALHPDVGVVAASGHILPSYLLALFPHRVLNVHASLLPQHRGASAVASAILAGDVETGATIMEVVREVDAGPIVSQTRLSIGPLDTTGTLTKRIAEAGATLLAEVLPRWGAGMLTAAPQDTSQATVAPKLTKEDGRIDWSRSAVEVNRAIRAFQPWPTAFTTYRGAPLTVHAAWPLLTNLDVGPGTVVAGDGTPLTTLLPGRTARALVACGSGALALLDIQRPGKRPVPIEAFLNGERAFIGSQLG